ncbi:hypothetical protein PHAVU_004G130200 [Phaseolus vulgaris]|uniref:Uncharacterized protein n=1 Tax=Phaseolus vulgaris TaxID=3885 RepID=V7C2Q1_PHAVU|nr:hypothetical protein PHAVU_004G130200g [Phaseolus vulgaris]ESW24429.1 hypothetical protein PHAVU_004G130200g [Phaseolus vulgaris]
MKSTLFLTLSFFLLFTSNFLPLVLCRVPEQVVDSNGLPISPFVQYDLSQLNFQGPQGGGVELDFDGNSRCQVVVIQNYDQFFRGEGLRFSTEGRSSGAILTETPLEIRFDYHPYCASSSKWVVVGDDFPAKWVGIGDGADHAGKEILSGTFMIKKYGEGYKFAFCSNNTNHNTCFSIGRIDDHKGRRLVLMDDSHLNTPFNFVLINIG